MKKFNKTLSLILSAFLLVGSLDLSGVTSLVVHAEEGQTEANESIEVTELSEAVSEDEYDVSSELEGDTTSSDLPNTDEGIDENEEIEETSEVEIAETELESIENDEHIEEEDNEQIFTVDASDGIVQAGGSLETTETSETPIFKNDSPNRIYSQKIEYNASQSDMEEAENAMYTLFRNYGESVDIRSCNLTIDEATTAFINVINSHPELYYVSNGFKYKKTSSEKVSTFIAVYLFDKDQCKEKNELWDSAVSDYMSGVQSEWCELEKLLYLNNYITKNCMYDPNVYNKTQMNPNSRSAYGCLVDHVAVCQGYALATNYLCHKMGVESCVVTSDDLNHAWNLVKVDGKVYQLDVTWDDPTPDIIGRASHNYFLKSNNVFATFENHKINDDIDWACERGWDWSAATSTKYDSYIWDSIETGMIYMGDHIWYASTNSGLDSIKCDTSSQTMSVERNIKRRDEYNGYWKLWDNQYSHYLTNYSGLGVSYGKIYFSGSDKLYRLNSATGECSVVYELTADEKKLGYIYGLNISNNVISYCITTNPRNSYESQSVKSFPDGYFEEYDITYELNGGMNNSDNPSSYCGADDRLLYNPTRDGYIFAGWYVSSDLSGTPVSVIPIKTTKLYAAWNPIECKITFDTGTKNISVDPVTVYYDSSYGLLPVPRRVNYDFLGWYDGPGEDANLIFDGEHSSTVINKTIGDHTLYAKWAIRGDAKVAAPSFSCESGDEVEIGRRIRITCETNGALIYYTTDGTEPTVDDANLYGDEIEIGNEIIQNGTVTIKAKAVLEEYTDSDVVTVSYTVRDNSYDWGDLADDEEALAAIREEVAANNDAIANADDVKANDIPNELWLTGVSDLEYTGTAVTQPGLRVYWGTKLLTLNTDYTVKYANNVKAGTATVTITGKGNYTGTIVKTFTVKQLDISDAQAADIKIAYNKNVQKSAPVLTYILNGKTVTLKNGTDYTLNYTHTDKKDTVYPYDANAFKMPSEEGYDILITGKGNYAGIKKVKEMIYEATKVSSLSVSLKSAPFNKEEASEEFGIMPGTGSVIKSGKTEIPWDKIAIVDRTAVDTYAYADTSEYWLVASLENNTAVGTAKITLTGVTANGYVGTVTKTFAITGNKISTATFPQELTKSYTWTGDDIKPLNDSNEDTAVYIKKTGEALKGIEKLAYDALSINDKLDCDYTYEYVGDTKNAGSVKIVITGVNAYTGSVTKTYKITAKSITSMGVRGIAASYPYTGDEITFDSDIEVYVKATKTTPESLLNAGDDYTISYTKNINAGTATVVITGVNAYTGSIKKSFKITACKITEDCITINDGDELGEFDYIKGGVKPTLTITDNQSGSDYTLVSGKDYTLSYSNNNAYNDGSNAKKMPTVKITGKGNYTGTVSKTFIIDKSDMSAVKWEGLVTAADYVYRNSANVCNPTVTVTDSNGTKMAAGSDYVAPTIANGAISYAKDCEVTQKINKKTVTVVRRSGEVVEKADIIPTGALLKATINASPKANCNYVGSTTVTYRVIAANISSASVSIKSKEFTGKPVILNKDDITITVNKKPLAKTDYEIESYTNNINKGTAKVTLRGIGNYGGTKTVNFTITAKNMNYTLKYDSNNDYFNPLHTYAASATGNMKDSVTAAGGKISSNSYKRTAYVFDGWNTKPDGTGASYTNAEKFELKEGMRLYGTKITLYAQWKPVEYKITYSLNKGPNAEGNPTTYTIENDFITLNNPVREGYDFGGWFQDSGCKKPMEGIAAHSTGNKTIYAKWVVHKYNVYFNSNVDMSVTVAGTMSAIENKAYDAKFSLPANKYMRSDGYIFNGWNTMPDGSGTIYSNKASVSKLTAEDGGDVILYAQWVKKKSYENPELTIWNYLMANLGNEFGVAGLMGNLFAESGLRSNNLQNSYENSLGMSDDVYTQRVDDGSYGNFVYDKAGYGLAQWTFYSRKQNLLNYAHQQGTSISDLDMQLEFLVWELKNSYGSVWQTLKSATTIREAAECVLLQFEKPKDQSQAVKDTRTNYADRIFKKYASTSDYAQATLNDAVPFTIYMSVTGLNVREGPGTNYSIAGTYTGTGTFQIVKTSAGQGSNNGWGMLPLGGWISLDYALRVK